MRLLLTGQRDFNNRGCEAIVRSTVAVFRSVAHRADLEFLVPTSDPNRDGSQWPEASSMGVTFVKVFDPTYGRYWIHLRTLLRELPLRTIWPLHLPSWVEEIYRECDGVLSVGGDNYSMDYKLPLWIMALDRGAMKAQKPVFLWGASVGPFGNGRFVHIVLDHLSQMQHLYLRESMSYKYLAEHGLENITLTSDPAFTLQPEIVDISGFWPPDGRGVLGVNVSPLVEHLGNRHGVDILGELARVIDYAIEDMGLSILLVPHVGSIGGVGPRSDEESLRRLYQRVRHRERVSIMPSLNAPQTKYVIGMCRFLIAARTHATIAAFSMSVPTISIGYSRKSMGLNYDLFGHTDLVVAAQSLTSETVKRCLDRLLSEEHTIRAKLAERAARNCESVRGAASHVVEAIAN